MPTYVSNEFITVIKAKTYSNKNRKWAKKCLVNKIWQLLWTDVSFKVKAARIFKMFLTTLRKHQPDSLWFNTVQNRKMFLSCKIFAWIFLETMNLTFSIWKQKPRWLSAQEVFFKCKRWPSSYLPGKSSSSIKDSILRVKS